MNQKAPPCGNQPSLESQKSFNEIKNTPSSIEPHSGSATPAPGFSPGNLAHQKTRPAKGAVKMPSPTAPLAGRRCLCPPMSPR